MRKIAPEERKRMRQTYVKKLVNVIRSQGFLSLTIQDFASIMNMSRASLYNYFSSKDDIILELTNLCTAYIKEAGQTIANEALPYPLRLQKVFEQAVLSAAYTSDQYLSDLKRSCPTVYQTKLQSRKEQRSAVHLFYQNGMEAGVFNELNPDIVIIQDEIVLNKLMNSSFLLEENLSLKQALCDYYDAKIFQVLKPEFFQKQKSAETQTLVEQILLRLEDL